MLVWKRDIKIFLRRLVFLYAIAFDIQQDELDIIYCEVEQVLRSNNFERVQDNLHLSRENDIAKIYRVINGLREIILFKENLKEIRVFKISDWSNFTEIIKS
jgi:virulence-associated protein VapD